MNQQTRRVAVLGGNRIPFARSNSVYADASNQEMLTAALDGLVDPLRARGRAAGRGRRRCGAQALPRLQPDPRVGARLQARARDARHRHPAGLRHRAPGRDPSSPTRSRSARSRSAIAGGTDTTSDAPVAISDKLRKKLMKVNAARDTAGTADRARRRSGPATSACRSRRTASRAPRLSMGEHAALTALEWRIGREEQDELAAPSHQHLAAAYDAGFLDDQITPFRGLERDQNLRPDSSVEKLAKLKPVFGKGEGATMTAGNSTPLTDGASAVLLASEDVGRRARPRAAGLPGRPRDRRGRLRARQRGAADGSGVRRAAAARAQRPDPAGLRLLRDPRGVRLAGARDAEGVGRPGVLQGAPRPRLACSARSTGRKLNVNGSSLAAGHPFAATGGRILNVAAKLLAEKGSGRALISICAAGGQGVTAILER